MVGRVGNDQFGERYRSELDRAGADVSLIETESGEPTGTALIEVAPSGDNRIVIVAGANGTMTIEHVRDALTDIRPGDTVLLQLEIPMETVEHVAAVARQQGAVVILDPAPADTLSPELLSRISWLTPNEHEASVITGIDTSTDSGLLGAAEALAATGVENVVIKAGARGAWYVSQSEGSPVLVPGFTVEAVDTTAAVDSFNAGLAWALGDGKHGTDAIRTASAVAAISVTGKGAQGAMPSAATVEQFLARNR
jgi:ribokinase